jgi:uncharacterized protein involved in exopolysaccharide biosynthesis
MHVATAPATQSARDKFRLYWRRRWMFFGVAGVSALAAIALAIAWPPTYRTGSTILIEQQEIPQELVRSAITSFADQRVQVISQRVMTTQNLMAFYIRTSATPSRARCCCKRCAATYKCT